MGSPTLSRRARQCGVAAMSVLAAVFPARGDELSPDGLAWQKIRDEQPAALALKVEWPKTTYYQGEAMEGTVTLRNSGTAPYNLFAADMVYPRNDNVALYATGTDGALVRDPMRWYQNITGYVGSSPFSREDLGTWTGKRVANSWVIFDRPGTYSLFAVASVQAGTFEDWLRSLQQRSRTGKVFSTADEPKWIKVVSDPITVTILPLPAEEEKRLIAEARKQLSGSEEEARKGAMALRYLGTPAAREALRPLLGGPQSEIAALGICAAPDTEREAALLREAVRTGQLPLNLEVLAVYRSLKAAFFGQPWAREKQDEVFARYRKTVKSAEDEIVAAGREATKGKGSTYDQMLIDLYPGLRNPDFRAGLVRDQLKLEPAQVAAFFHWWQVLAGADFQPLVRKAVGAPYYNETALRVLAETEPAAARPIVIEDIQRGEPRRYSAPGVREGSALLALPAGPIPELEPYFRKQLQTLSPETDHEPEFLMAAVNRYGTPALLPDLIAFHQKKHDLRDCEAEMDALRFWVRNDPAGGLAAVKQALQERKHFSCHGRVLEFVLLNQWTDEALPLVTEALNDPDPGVVASAIQVLERNADVKWQEPALAAIERLAKSPGDPGSSQADAINTAAGYLLDSQRWVMSAAQRKRLEEAWPRAKEHVSSDSSL